MFKVKVDYLWIVRCLPVDLGPGRVGAGVRPGWRSVPVVGWIPAVRR